MNEEEKKRASRRSFFKWIVGAAAVLTFAGQGYFFVKSLFPRVLYEPLKKVKIGWAKMFPEGEKFFSKLRVFVFKKEDEMYTMSSVCTHLGCNVQVVPLAKPRKVKVGDKDIVETFEFYCPCHGSKYHADGTPYAGPAPTPLARYELGISPDDGQLVVNTGKEVGMDFRIKIKS